MNMVILLSCLGLSTYFLVLYRVYFTPQVTDKQLFLATHVLYKVANNIHYKQTAINVNKTCFFYKMVRICISSCLTSY